MPLVPVIRRLRSAHRAWVILGAAFLALFMLGGARNSVGVLFKPMAEDFGGGRVGLAGALTLGQAMLGLGYVIAGLAVDRFGPRRVIPVFAVLHLIGNLVVGRATHLWEVYLGWGVLSALAFGIGVGPFMAIVTRWFQRYQGLALGITASAAQLGVVTLSPIVSVIANGPGWRWAFVLLAVLPFLGLMLAASIMRGRPQEVGIEPLGGVGDLDSAGIDTRAPARTGVIFRRAVGTKNLWILLIAYIGANVGTGIVLFHLVNFGTDQGLTPLVAAGLLATMSGVSVAGRVAIGILSERLRAERLFTASLVGMGIGMAVLPLLSGPAGYFLFASFFGFFLGGTVVLMPLLGRALLGDQFLAAMVGVVLLAVNIGSALGALLGGAVFDATGSYALAFIIAAIVLGAASLLTTPMRLEPGGNRA